MMMMQFSFSFVLSLHYKMEMNSEMIVGLMGFLSTLFFVKFGVFLCRYCSTTHCGIYNAVFIFGLACQIDKNNRQNDDKRVTKPTRSMKLWPVHLSFSQCVVDIIHLNFCFCFCCQN